MTLKILLDMFINAMMKTKMGSKAILYIQNANLSNDIRTIRYNDPYRIEIFDLISKIKMEVPMLLEYDEAYALYMAVKRTEKIAGDIAEVGVYKGGSSKLICEAKGDKNLHVFDTFEGIPEVDDIDYNIFNDHKFKVGEFPGSFELIRGYLSSYKNVFFYKGVFPSTANSVANRNFSLVHLDVDTCVSTSSGLEFFYPRMNRGGIIISHDYINAIGVRKAFDEFFSDKLEPVIEIARTQCLVSKL